MTKNKKRVAETISVPQIFRLFPDDDACYAWLERSRWGENPICAHCGGTDGISPPSPSKPHHYWCKSCRKHFTVTTKTIMHSRKTSLQNWVIAILTIMTARKSVSALQLSKELGVDYKTSWYMLHRIREACAVGSLKLEKVVEVDETYVGGKRSNMSKSKRKAMREAGMGRGSVGKVPVMGAKERGGPVVAKPIKNADAKTATEFVASSTDEAATVYTDESRIYGQIPNNHDSVCHSAEEYVRGDVHTNSIEVGMGTPQAFDSRHSAPRQPKASSPVCERSCNASEHRRLRD